MYDNKYIKTKIKISNNKINTNFYGNKMPKDNECCTCLSVISLIFTVNVDKIFLEECKYAVKKRKMLM